jgi:hypothetical protein
VAWIPDSVGITVRADGSTPLNGAGSARGTPGWEQNGVRSQQGGGPPAGRRVLNGGHLELIDELYAPELAEAAKRWIAPSRVSFPDLQMQIVELVAEGDTVVGRLTCSATHLGPWLGYPPTGRRFERVDEVSVFRFRDGRIVHVWSLDDTWGGCASLGSPPSMATL